MPKLQLFYPVKPWSVSQGFGIENTAPSMIEKYKSIGLKAHNGIDIRCRDAQPVRASHDGIVTFTGEDGSGGLGVVIRTETQFDYLDKQAFFKTLYWHLKPNTFKVKAGQKVVTGDILALADNTGMSTGTHLHWGCKPVYKGEEDWNWWNAENENGYRGAVNPQPYLTGIYAEDAVKYKGLLVSLVGLLEKLLALLKK